uniref:Tripartite motif containing 35-30 n=1 Tax=Monopterus albus TaxID=43700 RepID=A0A3Q3J592_MONAL
MASAEPWVGTWRPHKKRGPIAAQYGSPGPKYGLPGLTGVSKHDPTKYKAPIFSFGILHNQASSDCSPGPRYLLPSNITREGRGGTPAFSLHGRPKEPQLFRTPGPAHYSPECSAKSVFHSAPAYSLSGRSKEFSTNQIPGPASYSLPPVVGAKTIFTPAAPTYSICSRRKIGSFHEDLKKVHTHIYKNCFKPPEYSMTARNFGPGETTKKPGPGAHYPEQVTITKTRAPSFSFGLRHSEYILPFTVNVTE